MHLSQCGATNKFGSSQESSFGWLRVWLRSVCTTINLVQVPDLEEQKNCLLATSFSSCGLLKERSVFSLVKRRAGIFSILSQVLFETNNFQRYKSELLTRYGGAGGHTGRNRGDHGGKGWGTEETRGGKGMENRGDHGRKGMGNGGDHGGKRNGERGRPQGKRDGERGD